MPNSKSLKAIPELRTEDEEREFWAHEDSADYVDWGSARRVDFPDLRPSTKTISLRLPVSLLDDLKSLAHRRDVPYQSLLKIFLAERVAQETRRGSRNRPAGGEESVSGRS